MTTTGRNRTSLVRGSRRIAMVGLLVAALVALVVGPASTASAGRYSSAIKAHNLTKDATLVVAEVRVQNSYDPVWEEHATPVIGQVVKPGQMAHWELVTKPSRFLTVRIYYVIRDGAGKEAGKMTSLTGVEGDRGWWTYGTAKIECENIEDPFTCAASGDETVTVRDRE